MGFGFLIIKGGLIHCINLEKDIVHKNKHEDINDP